MFLIDDILKMLKADTDATRLRMLKKDVKTAVYAAEQILGPGGGKDKFAYAMDYLTNKRGYDPDKDMLRGLIEATVFQMHKDMSHIRKAKAAKAETAEEFKAKYGKKRFTAANAGKALIYRFIYWTYLKNEGMTNEEIAAQPLYNMDNIRRKPETLKDALQYNVYVNLQEWLTNAFDSAVYIRNATDGVISHFYTIVAYAIAGENLRAALGEAIHEDKVALWLSALSVDGLRPTKSAYNLALSLRANIDAGLRYLNVYNTLIDMIGKEIEIPEFTVFQVNISNTKDRIERLNAALDLLRDEISNRGVVPDGEAAPAISPAFTPKEMEATLEAYREVSPDVPPIPVDNVTYTERNLRAFVLEGSKAWTNLFSILSKDYCRRH